MKTDSDTEKCKQTQIQRTKEGLPEGKGLGWGAKCVKEIRRYKPPVTK